MRLFAVLMDGLDDEADRLAVIHVARVMYRLYGDLFRALPACTEAVAA